MVHFFKEGIGCCESQEEYHEGKGPGELMKLCPFVHLFGRRKMKKRTLFSHIVHRTKEVAAQCRETSRSERTFAERRRGKLHKLQSSTAVIIIITLWRIILTKDADFQEVCHFYSQARGANDDTYVALSSLATCFLPFALSSPSSDN